MLLLGSSRWLPACETPACTARNPIARRGIFTTTGVCSFTLLLTRIPLRALQKTDKDITVELATPRPDGATTLVVAMATERESSDLANLKLRNLDYDRFHTGNRGGVDDLIQLTHLHEPAILDVLQIRYAKDCIYSALACLFTAPAIRIE